MTPPKPTIDIDGIHVEQCHTDYGDYTFHFYSKDHHPQTVKDAIPNQYEITRKEHDEGGELRIWFLE